MLQIAMSTDDNEGKKDIMRIGEMSEQNSRAILMLDSRESVSYTHLDVYKRQK